MHEIEGCTSLVRVGARIRLGLGPGHLKGPATALPVTACVDRVRVRVRVRARARVRVRVRVKASLPPQLDRDRDSIEHRVWPDSIEP